MRTLHAAAWFAAALFFAGAAASAAAGWKTLAPTGASFTVDLPPGCNPVLREDTKELYNTRIWDCSQAGWRYAVGYTQYRHIASAAGEIATDRDNFNKAVNATLDRQRVITTDGIKGIEFISHSANARFRVRMWVRGDRAFEVGAAARATDAPDVSRFVESFHFTGE